MKSIYDYNSNISVIRTPNNDIVLTMNDAIYTALTNLIMDAYELQKLQKFDATASDTLKLWRVLSERIR